MTPAHTWPGISTRSQEAIAVLQAFIDKRGPVYFPAVGEDDPIEMTPLNAGIKEAYEAKYPNMRLSVNEESVNEEGEESFEWGAPYEGSTHQVLTLPNLSQREIKDTLGAVAQIVRFYRHNNPRVDDRLLCDEP